MKIFIIFYLVWHVSGNLGVISMLRKEIMSVLLEGGSECEGYHIQMQNMKMLITSLKLVQWNSYLD